jgi:hypothetical protein
MDIQTRYVRKRKTKEKEDTIPVPFQSNTSTFQDMDEFLGPPPYVCRICSASFNKQGLLKTHKRVKHPISLPNIPTPIHKPPRSPPPDGFKCSKCDEYFPDRRRKQNHYMRVHRDREKYACKVCPRKFVSTYRLRIHEASHSDARPFQCETCPKAFRTDKDLKKHVWTHSTERNHVCDKCGNAYQTHGYLINHIRYTHLGIKHYLQVKERERKKREAESETNLAQPSSSSSSSSSSFSAGKDGPAEEQNCS